MKSPIILNNIYGRLKPIKKMGTQNGHTVFECLCVCGIITKTKGIHLKNGHTKSCGCYEKEQLIKRNTLPIGEAAFNFLYRVYKYNANKRKLAFNITKEEFKKLTQKSCHYCGAEPTGSIKQDTYSNGAYIYNGVDRKDNNIGYVLTNCVPCCRVCNRAKMNMEYTDFLLWIKNLKEHKNGPEST